MEINAYGQSSSINAANLNFPVNKKKPELGMEDFLNLLVAQMSNQDAMNPMDNTEFISQMAQFSSLQAMSDLHKVSLQGQATSLIGKNIVAANYNNNGKLEVEEGIVDRVTIHSGEIKLYVNGKEFELSNVMEIKETKSVDEEKVIVEEKTEEIFQEGE